MLVMMHSYAAKYRGVKLAAVVGAVATILVLGLFVFEVITNRGHSNRALWLVGSAAWLGWMAFLATLSVRSARTMSTELKRSEGDLRPGATEITDTSLDDEDAIVEMQSEAPTSANGWYLDSLLERYTLQAADNRLQYDVLHVERGDTDELQNAIIRVVGVGAYGAFKNESGVHRSAFESERFPVAVALVRVLPSVGDDVLRIDPVDITIEVLDELAPSRRRHDVFESTLRVTHLPSGIIVECNGIGTPSDKRAGAIDVIRARLYSAARQPVSV